MLVTGGNERPLRTTWPGRAGLGRLWLQPLCPQQPLPGQSDPIKKKMGLLGVVPSRFHGHQFSGERESNETFGRHVYVFGGGEKNRDHNTLKKL